MIAVKQSTGWMATHRMACLVVFAIMVSAMVTPSALAAEETGDAFVVAVTTQDEATAWSAPTEPMSVDDDVVTVGSHLAATATAEMLGLNGTVLPGQASMGMNPSSLDEAMATNRLGVYGSDANKAPNPYLYNLFYNYYADVAGLEKCEDAAVVDENTKAYAYLYYIEENEQYGIADAVALRPDVVLGVSGSPGQGYSLRMNQTTTTAINHTTWGTGLSSPSQPYQSVLQLRTFTADEALAGTPNSDGNTYQLSPYYREGDETYDPIAAVYDRGTSASGLDIQVDNANSLAWAAKLALQQDVSKTARYGDPLVRANDYERYVKAIKWAVLQRIAAGDIQRKTVAVVARVADGGFTLVKMNPDADTTTSYRIVEAAQDTVNDLAEICFPEAKAGVMRQTVSAEKLMEADVVVCMPALAPSYRSNAADVREALAAAGYDESSAGYPALFDNIVPVGTFGNVDALSDSVEAGMLVGLLQGYLYPEVVNPIEALAYFASELFNLQDSYVEAFVRAQLEGISLPDGISLDASSYDAEAVARVQAVIDAGVEYYYEQGAKSSIDAARPRIASTDALDDSYGYGTHGVTVTVPSGATFTLVDNHRLVIPENANGTFTLDDEDATTLTVSLAGYRDYTRAVTGSDGSISVSANEMTKVKTVTFVIPDGASITWVKDDEGRVVKQDAGGTYTLPVTAVATYCISLEGCDPFEGSIAVGQTIVEVRSSDFKPVSTATQINVPNGAKLSVTDADGVAVEPQVGGVYKLYNGYTYTLTVKHPLYELYTTTAIGGASSKITIRLSSMTPSVDPVLTIDVETVTAEVVADEGAAYVSKIVLGPAVKTISGRAFASCPNLKTLTFGEGVQSVGASAFANLTALSSVTFNSSLKSIGASAFEGCTGLTNISVPSSVTAMGACAFKGCTKLASISLPSKAKSIGSQAFMGCSKLTKVSLGKKMAVIGKQSFSGCTALAALTISEGVTTIGEKAFEGCTKLKKLTIKTKKLKKAKVKRSLIGSKVKTIRVSVGKAKDCRTYVKKYKKIFTKKICGKKVTVRK